MGANGAKSRQCIIWETIMSIDDELLDKIQNIVNERDALRAKVATYQARLEIDHDYDIDGNRREIPESERDDGPDGIECRDETIKELERQLAANRESWAQSLADAREQAFEEAAKIAEDYDDPQTDPWSWPDRIAKLIREKTSGKA